MIISCGRLYHPFIESSGVRECIRRKELLRREGLPAYYIPAAAPDVPENRVENLKVQLNCKKCKQKAMKTVAGVEGVVSVAADWKEQKMTVIGDADPVCLTASLRKFGCAELVSVGPSKEPEKKKPDDKKPPEKKSVDKEEPPKQSHTYVIIPASCNHCSDCTYYLSDENPNACCIV